MFKPRGMDVNPLANGGMYMYCIWVWYLLKGPMAVINYFLIYINVHFTPADMEFCNI